jgi:cytochrome P450
MQAKAWVNDSKTFLALRSSNYLAGQIAQRLGASIYCPGIGHIVSDPTVARTIMADQEHFSINEAGGLGSLISEIWGNAPTLLSMDGVEHHRVKFALLDSFKEEALSLSLGYELGQLTSVLISDLQAGKQVDIAQYIRIHTLHITSKLLGVEAVDEAKILYISDLVTNVMGCVDLKNKTFSKSNRQKARTYVQKLKVVAKEYYTCPNLTEGSLINKLKNWDTPRRKPMGL